LAAAAAVMIKMPVVVVAVVDHKVVVEEAEIWSFQGIMPN
jgi:hypothetical protein